MERYTAMYPRGQPGLPDDPVTAYVNNLRATGAAFGPAMTWRTQTARQRDPTRECNVCVASASSSSDPELAPHHRTADAQRRARLDELTEAKRQLDEKLAILHQELGMVLTVNSCIKVRLDLQADRSPVVVKGPFFPQVVNPRYRIRGTMRDARYDLVMPRNFNL
jgi:hypothetical protein